jgi:hypothetical protein
MPAERRELVLAQRASWAFRIEKSRQRLDDIFTA